MTQTPHPLLLIIDGSSILHRAYHALPPLTAPDGRLVNACYGFLTMFFKAVAELKPSHIAIAFDRPEPTFRKKLFSDYQAQREKKPDELYAQIPIIKDLLTRMKVALHEAPGFEADDVIGTIVDRTREQKNTRTKEHEAKVIILTGDKDLLQLVGDGVEAVLLRRGMTDTTRYDVAGVIERFGFPPERLPDFKALAGDPSDNYPGIPGIGEKTAAELVKSLGGIDEILKSVQTEKLPPGISEKLAEKIRTHTETARLGLKLATIVRDVPIIFSLADCARAPYDREALVVKLRALGFLSLLNKLPFVSTGASSHVDASIDESAVQALEVVSEDKKAQELFAAAQTAKEAALALVVNEGKGYCEKPQAVGIAIDNREAIFTSWEMFLREGALFLRDEKIAKDTHNAKTLLRALNCSNIALSGLRYDTEVLCYLLAPGSRSHDLPHVAFAELGVELEVGDVAEGFSPPRGGPFDSPAARSGQALKAAATPAERAGREAIIIARLVPALVKKVEGADLMHVYEEFERPLIPVLQRMEALGVLLDTNHLKALGKQMRRELEASDRLIIKMAGEDFNIDSPQQLKRILFEKLGLVARGIRKTAKGGTLSTAASELEKLRGTHPIVEKIFEHRELAKLLSTYVETLPVLVDPLTGRVHTTYHQTVTATGRLSSSNPNLQNIPVTEPWGPEIRRAFTAANGWRLLAVDYSQFELRIAAALSGDHVLQKAFQSGADIHAATGAEIFGVSPKEVTRDQRRVAKAINFGILYGMGATALAQTANIARAEAEEYISRYFQIYGELAEWVETTKALARKRGYVETLFGRKRFLPEITSGVPQVRAAAERMAVNMPIQGTQADLLKLAMIRADAWIKIVNNGSGIMNNGSDGRIRMVLTVHDELVFEVHEDFMEEAVRALTDILEHVHQLPVPIVVEAKVGKNWGTMERIL